MKRKVLIIYTGGTIGMEKDYETNSLRAFDFNHIFNIRSLKSQNRKIGQIYL